MVDLIFVFDVFKVDGKKVGLIEFFVVLFDVKMNILLIYQVVVVQFVVVCQGMYLIKCCGEVFGVGCKFFKQKGMGNVCQGFICVLYMIGGGIVYGLKLCDYLQCIFKKMIVVVLLGVFSDCFCGDCLYVIDMFGIDGVFLIKVVVGFFVQVVMLKNVFVVIECGDEFVFKSLCNFINVYLLLFDQFNVYDVFVFDDIVFIQVVFEGFIVFKFGVNQEVFV